MRPKILSTSVVSPLAKRAKSKGASLNATSTACNEPFKPEINMKSKKMRRSGSVEDILYRDAF